MMTTCPCGRPIDGASICGDCTKALEIAIANISAYWQDLDNVRAGLTRYGGQGGRSLEHRLPIDPRFAECYWVEVDGWWVDRIPDGTALLDAVRNTVTSWVRVALDAYPASRPPVDTIPSCCNYLLSHVDRMRVADWGPEILDEMDHLELQLRRMVDRPADKWFAGPCDQCERDLYARTGAAEVTCPECDLVYDVDARRAWLLQQAEDRLVNATLLARAVSWLGAVPLTADRVWKWAQRGRILAKTHEVQGGRELPLYRIGDALDLLAADSQKAG